MNDIYILQHYNKDLKHSMQNYNRFTYLCGIKTRKNLTETDHTHGFITVFVENMNNDSNKWLKGWGWGTKKKGYKHNTTKRNMIINSMSKSPLYAIEWHIMLSETFIKIPIEYL